MVFRARFNIRHGQLSFVLFLPSSSATCHGLLLESSFRCIEFLAFSFLPFLGQFFLTCQGRISPVVVQLILSIGVLTNIISVKQGLLDFDWPLGRCSGIYWLMRRKRVKFGEH